MISLQGFILRTFLRLRKAGMDWDAPVEKFRALMEWGDRFIKLPKDVDPKSVTLNEVPAGWIIPRNADSQSVILYIHGGGWTMGWYNLHRRMVAYICQAASSRALAVDYRLAPEQPFPSALEDCLAVYRWLLKNGIAPENIVIAGDSAGANLTLSTLTSLRNTALRGPPLYVFLRSLTC